MIVIIYDQGVQTPVEIPDSDLPLWVLVEMCREARAIKESETK